MKIELWFLGIRLKAIKSSYEIINSNPFSGPYSLLQIDRAKKNREMNTKWFIRNFQDLKKKVGLERIEEISNHLGISRSTLQKIDDRSQNN